MRRLKKKRPQGILRTLLGQSGLQNQTARRTLRIESLESRQMLSAAPWMQNSRDSDHTAEDVEIRVGGEQHKIYDYSQSRGNDIPFNDQATIPHTAQMDNLRGSVTVNFVNPKATSSMDSSTEIIEFSPHARQDNYEITNLGKTGARLQMLHAELDGIPSQMALMQSFSYSGNTMRKNDTSVAGDQYQTDTCHIDNYGTCSMAFKSNSDSKDGIHQVKDQYEGSRAGGEPNGAIILSDRSSNDTGNWIISGWHIENFSIPQVMSQLGGQEGEALVDKIGIPTDGVGWVSVENLGCNFPPHNASSTENRSGSEQHKIYDYSQGVGNDITFNCHATPDASNLRGSVTVNFVDVQDPYDAYSTIFSFEFQELTLLQYNSGTTADVDHPGTKPIEAAIQSDRSSNDTGNWIINGWHIENFSVEQVMSQLGGQEGEALVDTIGSPTEGLIAIIALNRETSETDHASPQQIDGEATDKDHKDFTMSLGDIKGEATDNDVSPQDIDGEATDKNHIASEGMKDAATGEFTQCHLGSSEYVPGAPVSGGQPNLKSADDVGFNPQPQPPGNDWVIVGNPSLQEQPGAVCHRR
ncbi:MAG: hypothetical protein CMJ81_11570 [Planctomycetaceae bacterium]|nr:hypothetical protein [Planctomycetaceae bacterium]